MSTPVDGADVNAEMSPETELAAYTFPGLTLGEVVPIAKFTKNGKCGFNLWKRRRCEPLRFATTSVELLGSMAMPTGTMPAAKGDPVTAAPSTPPVRWRGP